MATLQEITASNSPEVTDIEALKEELNSWEYYGGMFDDFTIEVREYDSKWYLDIFGYVGFQPVNTDEIDDEYCGDMSAKVDREQFLATISEYLKEPLVIQYVSHEKCRYPVGARLWEVTPEGEIHTDSLERMSDTAEPSSTQA